MTPAPVSIAIVDDQLRFARALAASLTRTGRYLCVGICPDIPSALSELAAVPPSVLLLDMHLPGCSGLNGLPELILRLPGTRILMLTGDDSEHLIEAAFQAGAEGFILKGLQPDRLATLLDRAMTGEFVVCARTARRLVNRLRRTAAGPGVPVG